MKRSHEIEYKGAILDVNCNFALVVALETKINLLLYLNQLSKGVVKYTDLAEVVRIIVKHAGKAETLDSVGNWVIENQEAAFKIAGQVLAECVKTPEVIEDSEATGKKK